MGESNRSESEIEGLSEDQCRELLASRDLGRIGFSISDQPEIFPVNYAALAGAGVLTIKAASEPAAPAGWPEDASRALSQPAFGTRESQISAA